VLGQCTGLRKFVLVTSGLSLHRALKVPQRLPLARLHLNQEPDGDAQQRDLETIVSWCNALEHLKIQAGYGLPPADKIPTLRHLIVDFQYILDDESDPTLSLQYMVQYEQLASIHLDNFFTYEEPDHQHLLSVLNLLPLTLQTLRLTPASDGLLYWSHLLLAVLSDNQWLPLLSTLRLDDCFPLDIEVERMGIRNDIERACRQRGLTVIFEE
jgi:hypothetical protein